MFFYPVCVVHHEGFCIHCAAFRASAFCFFVNLDQIEHVTASITSIRDFFWLFSHLLFPLSGVLKRGGPKTRHRHICWLLRRFLCCCYSRATFGICIPCPCRPACCRIFRFDFIAVTGTVLRIRNFARWASVRDVVCAVVK